MSYMSDFQIGYRDAKFGFTYIPENAGAYADGFNFYLNEKKLSEDDPMYDALLDDGELLHYSPDYMEFEYHGYRWSVNKQSENMKITKMTKVSCPDCHGKGYFMDTVNGTDFFRRRCALCNED